MALTAAGSPLVAGSYLENSMQTQKVKVVRAFYHDRKFQKPDSEITVSKSFANELRAAEKVEFLDDSKESTQSAGQGGKQPAK